MRHRTMPQTTQAPVHAYMQCNVMPRGIVQCKRAMQRQQTDVLIVSFRVSRCRRGCGYGYGCSCGSGCRCGGMCCDAMRCKLEYFVTVRERSPYF